MAEPFRYAAFISYSSKDRAFAGRLHRSLEGYRIPAALGKFDLIGGGKRNRIYPIFRDREEMAAGQLGDQLNANLKGAAALIVVCSPDSAKSRWVQKEIEYFVGQGRKDRVFAVIPDTVPVELEGSRATSACFPPAFRSEGEGQLGLSPVAADARKTKDGFRNAWLKLVAGMIGVTPGQIVDRDKRQRRERALRTAAASLLPVIAIAAVWMNWDKIQPMAVSELKYRPFVHSNAVLMAGATGQGSAFQDCPRGSSDCPVMIVLPAGTFMMGSARTPDWDRPDERPLHQVSIRRFAVSKNDITFDDWQACANFGGCRTTPQPDDSNWGRGTRPVVNVSWVDAREYVAWLSQMTGQRYRLLSEAEWEYAARGYTSLQDPHYQFPWGNEDAVCDTHAPNGAAFGDFHGLGIGECTQHRTFPVGSFQPNRFSLYDMEGNVSQWVEDCYPQAVGDPMGLEYPYDPSNNDGAPVEQSNCQTRVLRGSSFADSDSRYLRSAFRNWENPRNRDHLTGFRIARTL